jgi:N-acetylglucosamine-6-phosphate deacetylase
MRELVFTGGTVILPDRLCTKSTVYCRDGLIASVSTKKTVPRGVQVVDLGGGFLSPGYIDIHVHGGQGADFMDGSLAAVQTACMAHARHGTTTIFPTTTTGSPEQISAMLAACAAFQSQIRNGGQGPNLAGIHLYGPYFAEDKVGCHSATGCRDPHADEYSSYFQGDIVRIATCAAELTGAKEFYRAARRAGCLITCGHSNASWNEMQSAFKAGMRHVDHFWCAMSSVTSLRTRFGVPMQASMTEFVLMNDEMSTEVIADGCHLSAELLEFAYRLKGAKRLCLVTDCNRALDMPPGKYRFGNERDGSWLISDGQVGWSADGQSLASSIVGLDHMVRQMKRSTSATLPEIVRMASLTPAERTGIGDHVGSIEVGKRADLLVLSKQLKVKKVYVRGQPLNA